MARRDPLLTEIRQHLQRLGAEDVQVRLDAKFEPETGTLLKVEYDGADWHMLPQDFRNLIAELPDGVGAAAVHKAIESEVAHLWHGPSPEGSRDTSG
jgi:hypothetical protein